MTSMVENTKYEELCRLCATRTTMVLAMHIFEHEGIIRQISKKIDNCLPIKVHEADELPKMICENCLYKLELFFDFRERTVHTERLLIELYKEIISGHSSFDHHHPDHDQMSLQLDNAELIMVQNGQLANYHCMENVVPEINLSQMGDCSEYQMMLNQHSMDLSSHSLDSIDLNGHELTEQESSNQGLSSVQEQALIDTSDIHNGKNKNAANTFFLSGTLSNNSGLIKHEDSEMAPQELNLNDIRFLSSYQERNDRYSLEHLKKEDSNSNQSEPKRNVFSEVPNTNEEPERLVESNVIANSYYCTDCGFSSKEKSEYQAHFESHLLKCDGCFDVFTNRELLNTHRKKHQKNVENNTETSEEKKVKLVDSEGSEPPEEEVNTEDSFEKDTSKNGNKKGGSSKVCEECGKIYKTNYKLIEHMRKHTGEKPYQCKSCDKAFRSKIGLTQHEAKHTGKYDLSCPTCGKGFQCKSYLMAHQRVHSSDRPFPCTTCGQNFKTKQSLLDHTNRHLGVKPYICDICGRGFITKGLCRAHQKTHTGLDNRKYSCKICNKLFVSKSYLQTHLRIHTGEKPFICEVCGKGFLTRVDLKIHSTMHTGEKSYVCEMCGKAFARRDALRCHRRSHTGERPYGCDLCGQSFTQFTTMAIHRRLHTGERPYSCETCGKGFVSRSTMMSHAKKHL